MADAFKEREAGEMSAKYRISSSTPQPAWCSDAYAELFDDSFAAVAAKVLMSAKAWRGDSGNLAKIKTPPVCSNAFTAWGALGGIRTHTVRVLSPFPLPVGIRGLSRRSRRRRLPR